MIRAALAGAAGLASRSGFAANLAEWQKQPIAIFEKVFEGLNYDELAEAMEAIGALGWDTAYMLDGIPADHLGVALDLRHLRADTGRSWKTMVRTVKSHIRSIYIKDAKWSGARSDRLEDVPVDRGFVSEDIFEFVRDGLPPMPLCLHMEHMGYRVFEKHEIPGAIEAHRKDIDAIRRWMKD